MRMSAGPKLLENWSSWTCVCTGVYRVCVRGEGGRLSRFHETLNQKFVPSLAFVRRSVSRQHIHSAREKVLVPTETIFGVCEFVCTFAALVSIFFPAANFFPSRLCRSIDKQWKVRLSKHENEKSALCWWEEGKYKESRWGNGKEWRETKEKEQQSSQVRSHDQIIKDSNFFYIYHSHSWCDIRCKYEEKKFFFFNWKNCTFVIQCRISNLVCVSQSRKKMAKKSDNGNSISVNVNVDTTGEKNSDKFNQIWVRCLICCPFVCQKIT